MTNKNYITLADLTRDRDCILNNVIVNAVDDWELFNGDWDTIDEHECYQQYIISENFANYIAERCPDLWVWYSNELDVYLLDIECFGISWTRVETAFKPVYEQSIGYRFATEEELKAR